MFLEDRYLGECFAQKFSVPTGSFGTGTFTINPTALSTTRKVLLMAGQCGGLLTSLTVTLNGLPFTFSNSTRVGSGFSTTYQIASGNLSSVHAIDITAFFSAATTNFTFTVPPQSGNANDRYTDFWFVFEYNNATLNLCNTCVYLNTQSMTAAFNHTYNIPLITPISTTGDVGVSLIAGYICNNLTSGNQQDAETIRVNGTIVGNNVGSTTGDGACGGSTYRAPIGTFKYSNDVLTGLGDSVADQPMIGLDALCLANALVNNGDTLVVTRFDSTNSGNYSNNCWGWIIVYTDTVTYPYECVKPNSIITSLITQTTARATWTYPVMCGGVLGDVNFQYRVAATPTWTVVPLVAVGQYDMTLLTANTNYEYQIVSTNCAGAVCAPSDIIPFTTLP